MEERNLCETPQKGDLTEYVNWRGINPFSKLNLPDPVLLQASEASIHFLFQARLSAEYFKTNKERH